MTRLIKHADVTIDAIEALFNDAYYETFRDSDDDLIVFTIGKRYVVEVSR